MELAGVGGDWAPRPCEPDVQLRCMQKVPIPSASKDGAGGKAQYMRRIWHGDLRPQHLSEAWTANTKLAEHLKVDMGGV